MAIKVERKEREKEVDCRICNGGDFSFNTVGICLEVHRPSRSSQLRPADKRYKKIVERDIIYDFKIPSAEEIEQIKAEKRQASEYKSEVEKLGKEQAEKDIDAKIQKAVDYRNEMNKKGKGKIQLAEIGITFCLADTVDIRCGWRGGCTVNAEDPMNLFFGEMDPLQT